MQFGQLKRREFIALKQFRSNGPVIASPQRSEGRSNPETTPGLLRRFAPRNDESLGSIPAKPALGSARERVKEGQRARSTSGEVACGRNIGARLGASLYATEPGSRAHYRPGG